MQKRIILFIAILTALVVVTSCAGMSYATSILIPGDTEEEVIINATMLKTIDEAVAYSYLAHTAESVRLTAATKLGEIGTNASLGALQAITEDPDETYDITQQAALSYWKIVYREDLAGGGDGNGILLSVFSESPSVAATEGVKGWALELLGDGGVEEALPIIEAIIADPTSDYVRKRAVEAQTKIVFIDGADLGTEIERLITEGLAHDELCVRKWVVDRMREQGYEDIIARLKTLYDTVTDAGDAVLGTYIAIALDEETEKARYPALEIIYPQDGSIIKTPAILIDGSSYGRSFMERWELEPGANTYTKTITDRDGNPVTKSVTVYFENNPPVLDHIDDVTAEAGTPLTLHATGSDADGDNLEFAAYNLPEGAAFDDATQRFSWENPQTGTYTVTFAVDDGWWLFDSQEVRITVTGGVPATNHAPVFAPLRDYTDWPANTRFTQRIIATDEDGDELTMQLTEGQQNYMWFTKDNSASRPGYCVYRLVWHQRAVLPGVYPLRFSVTDGEDTVYSGYMTITVAGDPLANHAPVFAPLRDYTDWPANERFTQRIIATDEDGDELTMQLIEGAQNSMWFKKNDSASRPGYCEYRLVWHQRAVLPGVYPLRFGVTDGEDTVYSGYMTITVAGATQTAPQGETGEADLAQEQLDSPSPITTVVSVNHAPVFAPLRDYDAWPANERFTQRIIATDEDGDELTMQLVEGQQASMWFTKDTTVSEPGYCVYRLVWHQRAVEPGVYQLQFSVTDQIETVSSEYLTITVTE